MSSPMKEVALYVDTTSYMQLRDLKAFAWRDLIPGVGHVNWSSRASPSTSWTTTGPAPTAAAAAAAFARAPH